MNYQTRTAVDRAAELFARASSTAQGVAVSRYAARRMRTRVTVTSLFVLAACTHEPAPAVVVPSPPPVVSATAPVASVTPVASAPMRPLVLGGPHAIENAAWMPDGSAIGVTYSELWHFRVEPADLVRATPLARPASVDPVLAVARPSGRVAAALDDGSVDVFESDGTRLRTLPAGRHVLELRFAPDGKSLAITRTNDKKGEWFERTAIVDLASGAIKSTVDGGNIVFDDDGKRIAARGGVFEVETGRAIAKIPEGFYVVLDAGVMGDIRSAHGEVMAGDYVARGWSGSSAYYGLAMGKDIATVGPGGEVTRFAASCAPGKKLGTTADRVHGRVISVCTDGVVVSYVAQRISKKIPFPIAKQVRLTAPDVAWFPEGETFSVKSLESPIGIFDPVAGTVRAASAEEARRVWNFSFDEKCAGEAGAREDAICDNPAWRPDGAFRMQVRWGFTVWSKRSAAPVIDWGMDPLPLRASGGGLGTQMTLDWHAGALEFRTQERTLLHYRLGPPAPPAALPFPATAPCGSRPTALIVDDAFTLYSAYTSANDRITSTTVCHCTGRGCVKTPLAGMGSPIAATDDGTFVTIETNPTMTVTTLALRSPGHATVTAKVPGSCIHGAFGPREHLYLSCQLDEQEELVELAVPALTVVRRHALPPIGRVNHMLRAGDAILVMNAAKNGWFGALLDADWLATDAPARAPAMLYAWPNYGIVQSSDGAVTLYGDTSAAESAIRCYDGKKLAPFSDACR